LEKWLLEYAALSCAKVALSGNRVFWDDAADPYRTMVEKLGLGRALPFEEYPPLEEWITFDRSQRLIAATERVFQNLDIYQAETMDLIKGDAERSMTGLIYADDGYGCLGCALTTSIVGMLAALLIGDVLHPSRVISLISGVLIVAAGVYTTATGAKIAWAAGRLYSALCILKLQVVRLRTKKGLRKSVP
jgi:hypothetical protein